MLDARRILTYRAVVFSDIRVDGGGRRLLTCQCDHSDDEVCFTRLRSELQISRKRDAKRSCLRVWVQLAAVSLPENSRFMGSISVDLHLSP